MEELLRKISGGRTDLVIELMEIQDWEDIVLAESVSPFQWFVYYNDLTAIKLMYKNGITIPKRILKNTSIISKWRACYR